MLQNSLKKYRDLKEAQSNLKSSPGCPGEGVENVPPLSSLSGGNDSIQHSRFPYHTPTPVTLRSYSDVPPTAWCTPPGSLGSGSTPTLFSIKKSLLRTPLTPLDTPRVVPQAAESNVKVVVRIRPLSKEESGEPCHLTKVARDSLLVTANGEQHAYTFDYVADQDASQDAFFRAVGRPMVENCLAGYNSSVFAFGQTGSGKTYTMLGPISPHMDVGDEGGLIPRMFAYLFQRIAEAEAAKRVGRELRFLCKISFLEIYQEVITDLLQPGCTRLHIREDLKRGVHVEGLSEESVVNVDEVMALVARGAAHRRVGETKMNSESSRSHCLLTCTIESKCTEGGVVAIRSARLDLVDLAGSERQKSVESEGERLKEATSINRSLSALGLVVRKLVAGEAHIPYRDSRLTFLMQDSLGGNAKTVFIATVSPAASCIKETGATLKFAQSAKELKNKAIVNEDTRGEASLLLLENARLRKELQAFYTLQSAKTPPRSLTRVNDENVAMKAMNEELCERLTLVIEVNQTLEAQATRLQDENARLRRERDTLDLVQQQAHAQMQLLVEAQLDARQKAAEEYTSDALREGSRKLANVEAQLAQALEEVALLKDRLKKEKDSSAEQLESYGRQAAETITALQSQVDGHKQMIEALKAASSQAALEQDAVALKLAAALQDTAAKLAAAEARDGGATEALQSVQAQLDTQTAKSRSYASQAHALLLGMVGQSQNVRTLTNVLRAAKRQVHALKEDNQRLQCLEAKLIEAETKSADGEERLRSSQARLLEADQTMQRMQEEMIRRDEVLNQCRAEIQQWQAQFAHLNKEIAEKEELLRAAREHAAGAAATASAADQRRLEMERRVSGLELTCMQRLSQIEELQSGIEDQRQEARAQRAAAAAQASSSEARERSLAQVNSLLAAMNAKVTSLRNEAESHRAQLRESHCQMAWLRGEIADREALLKVAAQTAVDATSRLADMEATSLHALEEARGRLAEEEAAHATALRALEEVRANLDFQQTAHAASLEEAILDFEREQTAHAESLKALSQSRSDLLREQTAHAASLEEARADLERERTAHAASAEALDEAMADLQRERTAHAASLEALDEALADLKRERTAHAASLEALSVDRSDLVREQTAYTASLEEARSDLERERSAHAASLEALSEARADLVREQTAHAASLDEARSDLERERSAHAASVEALEQARAELREEKAAHEHTLRDLEETWAELEGEQGARASFESLWNEVRVAQAAEVEKACQARAQLEQASSLHASDQEALAQAQGDLDKEQRAHASSLNALRQARADLEREEAAHEVTRAAFERAEAELVQVESSRAASVQALEEITERLKAEEGALATSLEAQEEAKAALEREQTAHAASLEALKEASADLKRAQTAHAASCEALTEARADLQREQTAHAASSEALTEARAAFEREQTTHVVAVTALEGAMADLEREQTAHAVSVKALTEARTDFEREQTAHAVSLEALTEARGDLEREQTEHAVSLEALTEARAYLEREQTAHAASVEALEGTMAELEEERCEAKAHLATEKSAHAAARVMLGQEVEEARSGLVIERSAHAAERSVLEQDVEEVKARLVQVEAAHATSLQDLEEARLGFATERSAHAADRTMLGQDVEEATSALAIERSAHAAERSVLEQDVEEAKARLMQVEAAHATSLQDLEEAKARLATERSAHAAARAMLEQDVKETKARLVHVEAAHVTALQALEVAKAHLATERSAHAAVKAMLEQDVEDARSGLATERSAHAAARAMLEHAEEGWSAAKRQVEALEGQVHRHRRTVLLAKSCFTSVHQAWVRGTGLLAVSAWKQQQLQEEVLRVQQCLLDAHNEARHLAAQVAGRDDHLLHLERRLTEAKSAVHEKDKQLSALLAAGGDTEDASRGATSALKAAELDAMLRSLRHDAERAKAAALADQRERFEADLADAAGRERTLREERDIVIGQQQQQVEQIQVMQHQLEAFRAQQAANARDISALRAERDLALDQLTDLQDLVDAEESLVMRCTDLEDALERAHGVKEQLQQHILSLEQDAAAEKAAADSHIADLKAEVSRVRAERDGALLLMRKPWQRRRQPKLLSFSKCKPSSVLRCVLGHRAILKQRRLKVYGRLQTPAFEARASTERLGFGLA